LVIHSQLPAAINANVSLVPIRGLGFALPLLLSLFASTTACADIYKWTDEQGNTVISNVRPTRLDKVKNFEVAVEETKNSVAATATKQMLLDKLDRLERQLVAQQYAQQAAVVPPYGSYNPALQPPPPPGYYGAYSPLLSYPYAFYPATTFVTRPRFALAHNGIRGGAMSIHRGRR
jgi:hypothetical protein